MPRDFGKIRAWKLADELAINIYGLTKRFPSGEMFGIASQLRRAAYSIPANIAEGSNRTSKKEYLQFLSVASGSLAEVRCFLHLSKRLKYLSESESTTIHQMAEDVSKTLTGLILSIRNEVGGRKAEGGGRKLRSGNREVVQSHE
jgi:four helix bundle protein